MALRWDVTNVMDHDSVCFLEAPEDMPMQGVKKGDRIINPVTNALIWSTIAVDLPGITRENAAEFFTRLRFTERLDGAFLIRAEDPETGKRPEGAAAFITEDEVLAHVGLSCNVTAKSRAAWLKRFTNDLDRLTASFKRRQAEVKA